MVYHAQIARIAQVRNVIIAMDEDAKGKFAIILTLLQDVAEDVIDVSKRQLDEALMMARNRIDGVSFPGGELKWSKLLCYFLTSNICPTSLCSDALRFLPLGRKR